MATAVVVLAGSSACGTRVSHQEVVAQARGSTVSLDQATIAALQAATPARAAAAAVQGAAVQAAAPIAAGPSAAAPSSSASVVAAPAAQPVARAAGAVAAAPGRKPATNVVAASSATTPCTTPGARLRLGQIGAFSGVEGPVAESGRASLAAWVQMVNAAGGVACHPVELYSEDDGADGAKAAAQIQDLVQSKHIQALVGDYDVIGFPGIMSEVDKLKIPVIGGDAGDFAWNNSPYLFPAGAGTDGIITSAFHEIHRLGMTSGALIYCVEANLCTEAAKVITTAAPKQGMKLVYSAPVSVSQPDYTAQCLNAKNAGAQMLGLALDGSSIGRVARSCAAINYHPLLFTDAVVFTADAARDPDIRKDHVGTVTAVAPWLLDDTAGQREYHAALAQYAPGAATDATSIQIWAAGKLLQAAVAGLGATARTAPITTADLYTGLGTIHNETLGGLIPPITFTPHQSAAPSISCAYFEVLTEKGWTTPDGSRAACG